MSGRVALLLLMSSGACWREGAGPAPPPLRSALPAEPAKPTSRWRASNAVTPKPDPSRTPDDIARQLADELRKKGVQAMQSFVSGPVVALDLDTGIVTTHCGAAAITAAQQWGQILVDTTRPAPHCRGSSSFTCSQFTPQQLLVLEFVDPDQWRIVSVMSGSMRSGSVGSKITQMRAQIATATCP